MKKKSSSQSACFNVRILIRLFILLAGIFLALLGLAGISNVFAQLKISTPNSAGLFSVPTFFAQGRYDVSRFSLPTTDGGFALDGFDPNANGKIRVVVVQPDGKILIGGDFTTLSPNGGPPVTRNHIARLNPDGTLDNAFDPNANNFVNAIVVQADGKILAGGGFKGANSIGGQTRNRIARLDPVSGLADSFNPNADNTVHSIAVQADGKILAGGDFGIIGGQTRNCIGRLDPTTGLADSFNPNAMIVGPDPRVFSIVVQADGKILVGGYFTSIGGQIRGSLARLDPTTGLADSFDPNPANPLSWPIPVRAIAVQADGRILVCGGFTVIGGQPRFGLARLYAATGLADSFDPNTDNVGVVSIAVQADGKISAGGIFTSIGGQPRDRIARLDPTTGLADSFNPNANDAVHSIAVQADGKILVGGDFTTIGGQTRNKIARLEPDVAESSPTPTPTATPSATPTTTATATPTVTPTPTPAVHSSIFPRLPLTPPPRP